MNELHQGSLPLGELRSDLFNPEVQQEFTLISGKVSSVVELLECCEKPEAAGPDCTRTPFSLVFRADVDENHPMQQVKQFHGAIHGHNAGWIAEGLLINRTLRPVGMPVGAYFEIIFN